MKRFYILLAASFLLSGQVIGQSWSQVPTPNPGPDQNFLRGISALSANEVWAVGRYQVNNFGTTPTVTSNLILKWDSTGWTNYPAPNLGISFTELNDVEAISSNNVWAVGTCEPGPGGAQAQLWHFDGSTWSGEIVSFPTPGSPWPGSTQFEAIDAISANDIWAVGSKAEPNVRPALAYHYNGTSWDTVSVPPVGLYNDLLDVDGIASNDVWAVGHYRLTHFGGQFKSMAMHWDGTSWTNIPLPASLDTIISELYSVKMVASNDVWATGNILTGGGLLLHWDGISWTRMPFPGGGGDFAVLAPNDIYMVGGNIVHWDGSTWTVEDSLSGFASASLIAATALPNGEVWAAGVSRDLGMNPDQYTLAYRKSAAQPFMMVTSSSPMVPAGTPVQLNAQPAQPGNYTYKWTADNPNAFSNPNIANPTVSPTEPTAYAVTVTNQNGHSMQGLVRVGIGTPNSVTAQAQTGKITAGPNPFTNNLTLYIPSITGSVANILLHDALGREVMQKHVALTPGLNQVSLHSLKEITNAGVYIVTIQTSDSVSQVKIQKH